MSARFTCNYAVVKFMPYPETGEFVNVGVVLMCAETRTFDFLLETKKSRRVTHFFPEIDHNLLRESLRFLGKEFTRIKSQIGRPPGLFEAPGSNFRQVQQLFQELTRQRESLICFGEVRSILTSDPILALGEVFEFYVERHFAQRPEYQEKVMARRLESFLKTHRLAHFFSAQDIGDDSYHVTFPFVRTLASDAGRARALKPLDLAKDEATEIYQHGDDWLARVRRLQKINKLPHLLFAVDFPQEEGPRLTAAKEICRELELLETIVVPFCAQPEILNFARAGQPDLLVPA